MAAISALMFKRNLKILMLMGSGLLLQACHARNDDSNELLDPPSAKYVTLSIMGYNYTNRTIAQFTVDGEGGDIARVSTPSSGGTGIVCCTRYNPALKDFTVKVRWTVAECKYTKHTQTEGDFDLIYYFYKTEEVPVTVIGSKPAFIAVHFYPGDRIEVDATEGFSGPRLKLPADRTDKTPMPRCKNDEKPTE